MSMKMKFSSIKFLFVSSVAITCGIALCNYLFYSVDNEGKDPFKKAKPWEAATFKWSYPDEVWDVYEADEALSLVQKHFEDMEEAGIERTDDEENGYVDVEGAFSAWLTSNHTLRRKSSVNHGVSVPPLVFNTFLEWDTLPVNTWDGLGSHSCDCGSTEILEVFKAPEANIYPNPTSTGEFTIETFSDVETIEVFSPSGKIVASIEPNTVLRRWSFDAVKWDAGIYFVNIKYSQGTIFSHRVVIR